MRARQVYESIHFTRTGDSKSSLGVGKKALIDQWFATWAPYVDYDVDEDFNIHVEEDLDLRNTRIECHSLPDTDNLSVKGYLDLTYTKITSLPNNLSVGRNLYLQRSRITSLPDNLRVRGHLDLRGTKITSLPDNLSVGGKIYKDF